MSLGPCAIMLHEIFAIKINDRNDMLLLEETIMKLLGGEQNKCALLRSQEFVNLRLRALYNRGPDRPAIVYGEGLKIFLDTEKQARVYLLELGFDTDPTYLGKRNSPDDDQDA